MFFQKLNIYIIEWINLNKTNLKQPKKMSETEFRSNLLPVAKELSTLMRVRQSIHQHEEEISLSRSLQSSSLGTSLSSEQSTSRVDDVSMNDDAYEKDDVLLKMEVYEDKDYDVDLVKCANFNAKIKELKSNVVKTLVYRVPESAYVIRRSQIVIK